MHVLTDDPSFATTVTGASRRAWSPAPRVADPSVAALVARLIPDAAAYGAAAEEGAWPWLVAVGAADRSQFDLLVEVARAGGDLPDGTLCLAGSGRGLHGQRGRPWAALPGNLHLSMWLAPPGGAVDDAVALLALAAVSVVETIDTLPGLAGRAGIKWVNDILIDGAKVCGMLTHVERRGTGLVGVLGIGLNVEATPDVPPSPFVPAVTSLGAASDDPEGCRLGTVLATLLRVLGGNYRALRTGGPAGLFARYRNRSVVTGRTVALCADAPDAPLRILAEGRVAGLGPRLELLLEGGERPWTTGRLLLRD